MSFEIDSLIKITSFCSSLDYCQDFGWPVKPDLSVKHFLPKGEPKHLYSSEFRESLYICKYCTRTHRQMLMGTCGHINTQIGAYMCIHNNTVCIHPHPYMAYTQNAISINVLVMDHYSML